MPQFMNNVHDTSNPAISIPVGIVVGLLASFVQSLGLTIQRKSHVQNEALPESERKPEYRRPLWLLGFGIFISSNLFGSVFQIASLPVVILAPLGAVSLLWNAFFARLILGDVFSPWMLLSTLCIAGGAVLIAVFGIVSEPNHSLEDLLRLFNRPAFVVYFSLLGVFTVICLAITHAVEYSYSGRIRLPDTPPLSPLLAPTTDPTLITSANVQHSNTQDDIERTAERTPLLDPKRSPTSSLSRPSSISTYLISPHTPVFLAMSYASFSGIIAGMCLLLAKSGVELLVLTFGGQNQFLRWQTWMLVLGLVVCALLQLWYMHKSLILAAPTLICPLAFCFYNLSSIINGLVYFDQFSALSTLHLLLVMLGMVVLLAGVWVVSFPPGGNHGIDVGAWGEPEEIAMNGDSEPEVTLEPYEDEPLPMGGTEAGTRLSCNLDSGVGLGIEHSGVPPQSPTQVILLSPDENVIEYERDDHASPRTSPTSTRSSRARRQTDSALLSSVYGVAPAVTGESPRTPPRRGRPLLHGTHSVFGGAGTTTSPSPLRQSFPPYSPGAPSGFSIGLSPVSPGFALVPRRRRMTSMEGVPDPGSARSGWRFVSDGNVGGVGGFVRGEGMQNGLGIVHNNTQEESRREGDAAASNDSSGAGIGRPVKGRWKLLSSLVKYARR